MASYIQINPSKELMYKSPLGTDWLSFAGKHLSILGDFVLVRNTPISILLIQLIFVISTLLISSNRLSWSENLFSVLTWKSNNR